MKTITTDNVDFVIEEDTYPFIESKEIVKSLDHWFKHPSRSKDSNLSNYSLDDSIPGSLGHSFETKLNHGGVFHFLRYKGEVVGFSGMYLEDATNIARGSHRMLTSPYMDNSIVGAITTYIITHQIEVAKFWGAKEYAINVNKKNLRIFEFARRGRGTTPSRQEAYNKIGTQLRISDTPEIINNVEQWVATIPL